MKFTDAQYCDFIVWRKGELLIQRIFPDVPFIDDAIVKAELFVKKCILPELIARFYINKSMVVRTETTTN